MQNVDGKPTVAIVNPVPVKMETAPSATSGNTDTLLKPTIEKECQRRLETKMVLAKDELCQLRVQPYAPPPALYSTTTS